MTTFTTHTLNFQNNNNNDKDLLDWIFFAGLDTALQSRGSFSLKFGTPGMVPMISGREKVFIFGEYLLSFVVSRKYKIESYPIGREFFLCLTSLLQQQESY